ncbi:Do family serine endopeptidase [Sodalis-like secondary symbiont of Drepanosiphum platanoidis]|uniref:Do family serine endopeptidase n=1 Tax=Sodalis-like secondary symbiont of Drepanosiphum platanoidis TaxID=2994493 RepID=UPI003464E8A4
MKKILISKLLIICMLFSFFSFGKEIEQFNSSFKYKKSLAPMLKKVLPTVVSIHIKGMKSITNSFLPKEFKYFFGLDIPGNNKGFHSFQGLGSGVLIDSNKGYIITNNHVIHDANKIKIKLNDGREFNAKLIGYDKKIDIALLQIPCNKDLTEIKFADSDLLHVGDFAVAVGNPFGLGQTATAGIISALGRSGLNIEGLENFIQTDASINRGNSGGALVNLNGELIGINTAILTPGGGNIGIGFAIPSNIVKNLIQQLITFGKVKHGKLGIKGIEITNDLSKAIGLENQKGIFVSEVIIGSSAEKSGIKSGDIIFSFEDKPIENFSELLIKISTTMPGKSIKLGILRKGYKKNIFVILNKNSFISQEISIPKLEGAKLINGKSNKGIDGVLVKNLIKNSPAWFSGLKKHDLIIELNNKKIKNIEMLKNNCNKKLKIMVFKIIRKKSNIFLFIS